MTRLLRCTAGALIAVGILSPGAPARAAGDKEKEKEAQALFLEAMKLMGKKQYADACEKLAKSQTLDPGMGTQFRLAECYEKLGRLASAFDQYNSVADAAKAANKPDREQVARRRAASLEARVAKLTIVIPPSVASLAGLEVTRDGAPVDKDHWGQPVPVDPGDHIVNARAPHKKPLESKVWAEGSARLTVSVALEDDKPPPSQEPPPPPKSKIPTIALGAAGGVGLVLGATFVVLRASRIKTANMLHDKIKSGSGDCVKGGTGMFAADCSALFSATSSGDTFGTAAVVSFVVGGAALLGMGTYLLLPGPSKPARPTGQSAFVRWSPVVDAGFGGVTAWGAF